MKRSVRRWHGLEPWLTPCVGVMALLAVCTFLAPLRAFGAQATLIADAHVNSAMPSVNSGSISNLDVGGGYTTLLQFDLSMLPAGTAAPQVSRALLRLYVNRVSTPGLVSYAPVTGAWGEYSVTYATQPSFGNAAGVISVSQAGAFFVIDVTTLVQAWITDPTKNNGLAFSAGTALIQLDSKENDETAHAASLDIELAHAGPTGATGLAGVQGAAGFVGPQGLTGIPGPAGAVGATGAAGPTGPSGTGSSGGLAYLGTYDSTSNYASGAAIVFQGSSYISLLSSNHGNTPGLNPAYWGLLAAAGVGTTGTTGATGPPGPSGLNGLAGSTGSTGAAGAQGTAGMVYRGDYASTGNYALGDVALWQGTTYTSLIASNHGNTPSLSPLQWGVLSAQGPAGPTGATGASAAAGPQGLMGSIGPNGPLGPQGVQGVAGQTGAQGIPGTSGGTGLSGPIGSQGIAGPVGLSFQGVYSSTWNYSLADGVSYDGAGYVSLIASNQGNTPGQSPEQWALFAAAGTSGATGPVGLTGSTGATGTSGPRGIPGATGLTGDPGAQGPPVANYLGIYQSTANYARNDAVSWLGSTYISLASENFGSTPSLSSTQWAILAAQGVTGSTGLAGVDGATGAIGATGSPGPAGPQGPPAVFRGPWRFDLLYLVGDAVSYAGSSYVALSANSGRQPDSTTEWAQLAAAGSAGLTGATGPTGMQGPTGFAGQTGLTGAQGPNGTAGITGPMGIPGPIGSAGPIGATGATGLAGIIYQGAYASTTNYGLNDAVTSLGSTYISLAASNLGNTPSKNQGFWAILAVQGASGTPGDPGLTGLQGIIGLPGAAGVQGQPGSTGATGPVGINFRGIWDRQAGYAANDAVTFAGSTYIAQAVNSTNQPDVSADLWSLIAQGGTGPSGAQGLSGPSGQAATVSVDSVTTTGAAGTPAVVTNTGSTSAAILHFTIPQGATGSAGSGGTGGGTIGIPGAAIYHSVAGASYISVSNSTSTADEYPLYAAATWIPAGCTATTLSVYSQQSIAITVKLRVGASPQTMVDTTLSCLSVATGASCTATGSATLPPGSFIDLHIPAANSTAAGVWTALTCN